MNETGRRLQKRAQSAPGVRRDNRRMDYLKAGGWNKAFYPDPIALVSDSRGHHTRIIQYGYTTPESFNMAIL